MKPKCLGVTFKWSPETLLSAGAVCPVVSGWDEAVSRSWGAIELKLPESLPSRLTGKELSRKRQGSGHAGGVEHPQGPSN